MIEPPSVDRTVKLRFTRASERSPALKPSGAAELATSWPGVGRGDQNFTSQVETAPSDLAPMAGTLQDAQPR